MFVFTSKKEKRLWILVSIIFLTIFSTLFTGHPLAELFADQNHRAIFFLIGMALVAIAIFMHATSNNTGKWELGLIVGIVAVYTMFFLRLGMAERSHIIEYSVLAILIHMALMERGIFNHSKIKTALLAFVITFLIGLFDECVQVLIPSRVFDYYDVTFNAMAAGVATGFRLLLQTTRSMINKKQTDLGR